MQNVYEFEFAKIVWSSKKNYTVLYIFRVYINTKIQFKGVVRQKIFDLILILFRSTFHLRKYSVLTKSISHHVPKYSGFSNKQMRCLMTSSTQRRPLINTLKNEEYMKQ